MSGDEEFKSASDEAIIRGVQKKEVTKDDAIETIRKRYQDPLKRFFVLRNFPPVELDDHVRCILDTFGRQMGSIRTDGDGAVMRHIFTVAQDRFQWALKEKRRSASLPREAPLNPKTLPPVSAAADPAWRAELHEALSRMDEKLRELLLMRVLGRKTFAEIAAHYGFSVNAAGDRYCRATQALHEILCE